MYTALRWILLCLAAGGLVDSIEVNLDSADSVSSAAGTIAYDMMTFYTGNNTGDNPGNLPPPYYWWEAGAMFMHMVDYHYFTGDPSYNPTIIQAITWQAGSDGSFMPPNQTKSEGNDDQAFWAFAAMEAAELNFPPPTGDYPAWASMATAVFNLQATRWDNQHCGGGLRWQIFPFNNGTVLFSLEILMNPRYNYKNIAANGGFFQLASRLARYTNNSTYTQWAEKSWDWISTSSLYDTSGGTLHRVYDGSSIESNCAVPNQKQYSYNYGLLIGGLAYLYNHTQDEKWMTPLTGLVNGLLGIFFTDEDIIVEMGCEPYHDCNTNGLTFKSFSLRWLTLATQLVPTLADQIWPYLKASAKGAAGQCDGGDSGTICGYDWTTTTWDGTTGVGQQMSALAAVGANMIPLDNLMAPLTLATGATSKSNPSAGTGSDGELLSPITTADRAGAGILTFLWLSMLFGGTYWLVAVSVGS